MFTTNLGNSLDVSKIKPKVFAPLALDPGI